MSSASTKIGMIDSVDFDKTVAMMRSFFNSKGFIEVHTQTRLSILAACEDPSTISTYDYAGEVWPHPQTGQMWLEYELLKNPEAPGFFCVSTSYRNEPNPVPGRHDKVFPMFEFEIKGGLEELQKFETEMLEYLGFGTKDEFKEGNYHGQGTYTNSDGRKFEGEWKDHEEWNGNEYNKDGKIISKYVDGKEIKQ